MNNCEASTLITTSKHFYFKLNGGIRWQKKPIELKSNKIPIVWYVVSIGILNPTIYCEISNKYSDKQAVNYYKRAFSNKCGVGVDGNDYQCQINEAPDSMVVTKKIINDFPSVLDLFNHKGIKIINPANPFSMPGSIVNRIKTIEDALNHVVFTHIDKIHMIDFSDPDSLVLFSKAFTENINQGRYKGYG